MKPRMSLRLPCVVSSMVGALFFGGGCSSPPPEWSRSTAVLLGDETIGGAPAPLPRLAAAPTIDGKLDEAAWTGAATLGPLVDTGDGHRVSEHPVAGFVRAGWDDRNLYLGFVVRDKAAASPFARDAVDPHIWSRASGVEVMLQPGDPGDNRDYYELQVDAAGAVFDTHWDDYMNPVTGTGPDKTFGHMEWTSRIERAVHIHGGAFWSVEIALPWAALQPRRVAIPPKPGEVWRMNLYTFRDGQRAALGWSSIRGQGNVHRSRRWGRVRF